MTNTFAITEERLLALLQAEDTLSSLNGAGVDNWDGCDFAFQNEDRELQDAEHIDPEWHLTGVVPAEKCFPVTPGIIAHTQEMYPNIDIKELLKAMGLKLNKEYFISILEKMDE